MKDSLPQNKNKISENVYKELVDYCKYYNLPINHIIETMSALKVVPMVRGICFEFTALDKLNELLSKDKWKVEKPIINAQSEIQDIDVLVTHNDTGKKISVECKLAKKESFKIRKENQPIVQVKCMRSRTVGEKAAETLAQRYNVSVDAVSRHADNYRATDFDFVVTSVGNAFWRTAEDGSYVFKLKPKEIKFLRGFFNDPELTIDQLRQKAFNYLLMARAARLTVSPQNGIECVRRRCKKANTHKSCGFIPNYPIVDLSDRSVWKSIDKAEDLLEEFVNE